MEVRTRYAPSPTGPLHLGSARTALFNYLFTKKNEGKFFLRIEDTDRERSKKEYEDDIIKSLKWLGIKWDEFFKQSERGEIYKKYLKKLVDDGHAYVSDEKEGARKEVIRFKNPGGEAVFEDLIRGQVKLNLTELGNFVIAKDFDEPLYHLAVVVDDFESGITHVIRGEDHISNTPRQILIQKAIGAPQPIYAHLPLLLGQDRSKLSKRHGAEAVSSYMTEGYLPDAMINFLALLGWHPADDKEIFTKEELIKEFELARVQKGGAICDFEKLNWFNREYIKKMPELELLERVREYIGERESSKYDLKKIAALARERLNKISDVKTEIGFIYKVDEYDAELLRWKGKQELKDTKRILQELCEKIYSMDESGFKKENLEKVIMPMTGERGRGEVLWPLRVSLSGKKFSPGPFEIMEILGRRETVSRIENAIEKIK